MQTREIREFLEALCNGTNEIPKKHHDLFYALQKFHCITQKDRYFKLKESYVLGSLDIVRKDLVFLQSFDANHSQDFRINRPFRGLCSGDIVLAKKSRARANMMSLLFSPEMHALVYLEKVKGRLCAIDLKSTQEKPIFYTLKARQKALAQLPLHTVLKISIRDGEILEILGVLEDERIDEKIVLAQIQREEEFCPKALEAAQSFGTEVYAELYPHRKNLMHLPFCTIDPIDAKDHDDAIYFDANSQRLYVAIADVSEYVSKESLLDKEAKKRGFTLYLPHKSYPMLPPNLSENICSLQEDKVRLAFVWEMRLDDSAQVQEAFLYEALIKNHQNLSYEQVDELLEKQASQEVQEALKASILAFYPYAQKLLAQRLKKGYTFINDEIKLQLDCQNSLCCIQECTQGKSHHIVEEAMLLANVQSAKVLEKLQEERGIKGIYRVHESIKEEKLFGLLEELKALGYCKRSKKQTLHYLIQDIQQWAQKSQIQAQVDKMIIKAQNQAQYASENSGHFGLGFDVYTHFTSPIRRYSDLCVHQILKAHLLGSKRVNYLSKDNPTLCKSISQSERMIARAEIEYKDRKFAHWAKRHLAQRLQVSVIDAQFPPLCVALEKITGARIVLLDTQEVEKFETFEVSLEEVNLANARIYGRKIKAQ